jgi:hypothetical protein
MTAQTRSMVTSPPLRSAAGLQGLDQRLHGGARHNQGYGLAPHVPVAVAHIDILGPADQAHPILPLVLQVEVRREHVGHVGRVGRRQCWRLALSGHGPNHKHERTRRACPKRRAV